MLDEKTLEAIQAAVERAFNAGVDNRRFIDVSRIPLICQSIVQIGKDIGEIKDTMHENNETTNGRIENLVTQDQFAPVKAIVYGIVALVLTTVAGALLALVITTS